MGTAYVGLKGLETLYGGEARLIANLLNAVPAYLNPRVGVGDAKFPAFIAARDSRTLGAARVPVDVRAFLAPRSIDLLPVSPDALAAMHRFGMHTMGQVSVMPERLMVDQFGAEGRRIWALCNGVDDSPLLPLRFEETVVEYASLPFYSTSLEVLLVAVDTLLSRAYARPWMKGRYASKASLGVLGLRRGSLGEDHSLQGRGWRVGAGVLHHPKPVGDGPAPSPCGGRDADPLGLHRGFGGAVGADAR